MNALTKAFVVVVTILAVILVALVIPFAARVPDYAQQYEDMKLAFESQLASANEAAADADADLAAKGDEVQKYLEDKRDADEALAEAESQVTALEAQLAESSNTMARMTAALETASRGNEAKDKQITKQAELINEQIAMIGQKQGQVADLEQTLINVRQDNRRLSNNYLRIQEENKSLATQVEEAQARAKKLGDQLAALDQDPDAIANKPVPTGLIRGAITKIDQLSEGLTFVQLNVGTRDKVQEGMEFTVYRGDSFVGKIQIASVDTAESVGRLTLASGGGVQEGDAVRAGGR